MIRKEAFEIDGRQVEIQQFGAVQGWKLLRKITSVVGPAIGKGSVDYGAAIDLLFLRLSEADLISLLKKLTQYVWVNDQPLNFETDMAVGNFSVRVLTEVLKLNYEEFFFTIQGAVKDLLAEMAEQTATRESQLEE